MLLASLLYLKDLELCGPGRPGEHCHYDPKATAKYDTGITIKPTKQRAFAGASVETKTKLSKLETGALGEKIVLAYLQSQGRADARPLNAKVNNFAVDMVQDHGAIECKAGL